MFFKTEPIDTSGKLYIMRFWLDDGTVLHKVGMTTRKPEDRLMEVLISFYKVYRYVPRSDIKRFKVVDEVYTKEAILLASLKEFGYTPEKKFSGCTETFIGLDEIDLLWLYSRVIDGEYIGTLRNKDVL